MQIFGGSPAAAGLALLVARTSNSSKDVKGSHWCITTDGQDTPWAGCTTHIVFSPIAAWEGLYVHIYNYIIIYIYISLFEVISNYFIIFSQYQYFPMTLWTWILYVGPLICARRCKNSPRQFLALRGWRSSQLWRCALHNPPELYWKSKAFGMDVLDVAYVRNMNPVWVARISQSQLESLTSTACWGTSWQAVRAWTSKALNVPEDSPNGSCWSKCMETTCINMLTSRQMRQSGF